MTAKKITRRTFLGTTAVGAASTSLSFNIGVVDGHTGYCMIMPVTKDAKPVSPRREYLLL